MSYTRIGGLWITNVPTAVALTDVPTLLTAWTREGTMPGWADVDSDTGLITIRTPGWYMAHCSLSFDLDAGRTAYAEFQGEAINGPHVRGSVEGIASGGRVNLSFLAAALMGKGDYFGVYVYSDLAATMTLVDGQFGVFSL